MEETQPKRANFNARYLAKVGIFSALTYVLYLFPKFPVVALFPSWLEFNFADIPALIGTFTLGPLGGFIIIAVKILLKLPLTSTACSGEFSDLLCGLALIVPAGLIYKYNRTLKGAIIAMLVGSVCSTVSSIFTNAFIAVPWFAKAYFGGDLQGIVNMIQPLFPNVTVKTFYNYYLWLSVVPFNLIRCFVASLITGLTYKHISRLINKF